VTLAPSVETKAALIVAILAFGGGFLSGYKVEGWHLTAKANAEEVQRTRAALAGRDEAMAAYSHLAGELSKSNDAHAAELRKSQDETNRLRDRLSSGAIGLRIGAKCPSPEAPAAPGARVDTGTGAELDSASRRAYFALRDGIDHASAKLAACQEQLGLRTGRSESAASE
jgi:hypothetical protein